MIPISNFHYLCSRFEALLLNNLEFLELFDI